MESKSRDPSLCLPLWKLLIIHVAVGCLACVTPVLDFSWHLGSGKVMYMIKSPFEWYPLRLRQYFYGTRFLKWRILGAELPRLRSPLRMDSYGSIRWFTRGGCLGLLASHGFWISVGIMVQTRTSLDLMGDLETRIEGFGQIVCIQNCRSIN